MESHGLPNQIQVTEALYQRLKNEFVFDWRGPIDIKGKGPTVTYLLPGLISDEAGTQNTGHALGEA